MKLFLRTHCVFLILLLAGCNNVSIHQPSQYTILGDHQAEYVWGYLCGLTANLASEQETKHRAILDTIGKHLSIKIIAVHPAHRCVAYDNKWCWPHESKEETLQTYEEIQSIVGANAIQGYIGFSNGGFFLNKLIEYKALGVPVISIGSAGRLENEPADNTIYLLIGKQDIYHYTHAHTLYERLKNTHCRVALVEYDEGHEIPQRSLEELLSKIILTTPNAF
jgi:hypothetical protein